MKPDVTPLLAQWANRALDFVNPVREPVPAPRRARGLKPQTTVPRHARPFWRQPAGTAIRAIEVAVLLFAGIPILLTIMPVVFGGGTGWTVVVGESMLPNLNPGDLVITQAQDKYDIGDVVVYAIPEGQAGEGVMVIHRVVGGDDTEGYLTLGDNREFKDPWRPTSEEVAGKHWRTIPQGGYGIAWLRSPLVIGIAMSIGVYMMTLQLLTAAEPKRPANHALPLMALHHL